MRRPARGLLAPENRAVSLAVMATMALAFYNAISVTAAPTPLIRSYNPDRIARD